MTEWTAITWKLAIELTFLFTFPERVICAVQSVSLHNRDKISTTP